MYCIAVCVSACLKMSIRRIRTVHHWFWEDGWCHRHYQQTHAFSMKPFASSFSYSTERERERKEERKPPCRRMKWRGGFVGEHLCLTSSIQHIIPCKNFMRWHLYSDVFHSWNFYDKHHLINLYISFVSICSFFLLLNFAGCCIALANNIHSSCGTHTHTNTEEEVFRERARI